MKKNIGATDKLVRLLLALLIAILYLADVISGSLGIILLIISVVLVTTSLLNFCGLYALLGISTCKTRE